MGARKEGLRIFGWAKALNYHIKKALKNGVEKPKVVKFLMDRNPDIVLTKNGTVSGIQKEDFDYKKYYEPRKHNKFFSNLGDNLKHTADKVNAKITKPRTTEQKAKYESDKRVAKYNYRLEKLIEAGATRAEIMGIIGDVEGLVYKQEGVERFGLSKKSVITDEAESILKQRLPSVKDIQEQQRDKQLRGWTRAYNEYIKPRYAAKLIFGYSKDDPDSIYDVWYKFRDTYTEVEADPYRIRFEGWFKDLVYQLHHGDIDISEINRFRDAISDATIEMEKLREDKRKEKQDEDREYDDYGNDVTDF